jgi:Rrf2 family protein
MLKFSRKIDYGILAIAHLSSQVEGPISARCLADRSRVPPAILANILKDLTRAGIVDSVRGAHGGYVLVQPVGQLTVGDVIRALEGEVPLVECVILPGRDPKASSSCNIEGDCPVQAPLRRLHKRLHQVVDELTFEELIRETVFAAT